MRIVLAALISLSAAAALAGDAGHAGHEAPAAAGGKVDREFKSVNIEVKGNKIWVPGTFIVKKGEKVRITLINTAPSGVHAFAIDGYPGTEVQVDNKEGKNSKAIEFKADKAGLFRVYCPMHPPHIGGQLLVLE